MSTNQSNDIFFKIESRSEEVDILSKLKASLIGHIYFLYLRDIPQIRKVAFFIWKFFFPIWSGLPLMHSRLNKWLPLIKMHDHVVQQKNPLVKIFDSTEVFAPKPKMMPLMCQMFFEESAHIYKTPEVYIAKIHNAEISGGTNIIFTQDAAVCHDLYDFSRDYTSEELCGRHVIDKQGKFLKRTRVDPSPENLMVAATFLDACASNYAHWLTEVLPRIVVFCSKREFQNIPLVINDDLHENILESVILLTKGKRKIYLLPVDRTIKVSELYSVSCCGYVPFEFRNRVDTPPEQGIFSPDVLKLLTKTISDELPQGLMREEKIYLRRNRQGKTAINLSDVEKILSEEGFSFIDPEKLSFVNQVKLFKNAKLIVSSSGAALANLIFCPPDTQVIILIGKSKRLSYWYWQKLAAALNVSPVIYVLGDIPSYDRLSNHPNFSVPLKVLAGALNPERDL